MIWSLILQRSAEPEKIRTCRFSLLVKKKHRKGIALPNSDGSTSTSGSPNWAVRYAGKSWMWTISDIIDQLNSFRNAIDLEALDIINCRVDAGMSVFFACLWLLRGMKTDATESPNYTFDITPQRFEIIILTKKLICGQPSRHYWESLVKLRRIFRTYFLNYKNS